jgi:hypothetical protein
MNAFFEISEPLSVLEEKHRGELNARFLWTQALRDCITGSVQFGTIDGFQRKNAARLPVVAAVGINYTQGGTQSESDLVPYSSRIDKPGTIRNTRSREAVALAIAAFNRNKGAWLSPTSSTTYKSPNGAFASSASAADTVVGDFILLMTNLSPFITKLKWQDQIKQTPKACRYILDTWPNTRYLDDFFLSFGDSIDLWIGHSSIHGTDWVWPDFLNLMAHWSAKNWLLTPNLSAMAANLHFKGQFTKETHALFPLFRPAAADEGVAYSDGSAS